MNLIKIASTGLSVISTADDTENLDKDLDELLRKIEARRLAKLQQIEPVLFEYINSASSDDDFFAVFDRLKAECPQFLQAVVNAGFSAQSYSVWSNKQQAPDEKERVGVLHKLYVAFSEYYVTDGAAYDLHQVLTERVSAVPEVLSLEATLDDLGVFAAVEQLKNGDRIKQGLLLGKFVTLGELLSQCAFEMRRRPGLSSESVTVLEQWLKERYEVGFQDADDPNPELERFHGMAWDRYVLTETSGKKLVAQWRKGVRYECRNWTHAQVQTVVSDGREAEVYNFGVVKPELIEKLEQAGVTYCTELATAPEAVVSSVCAEVGMHTNSVEEFLQSCGASKSLRLGMPIPLYLNPKVKVYSGSETRAARR